MHAPECVRDSIQARRLHIIAATATGRSEAAFYLAAETFVGLLRDGGRGTGDGRPRDASTAEMTGYRIDDADGKIGQVDDFLFDDNIGMCAFS